MSIAKSIEQEIVQNLPQLNKKEQQTILTMVKTLVAQKNDWWDEISDAQQNVIDKALLEMKDGKVTTHQKVMQQYK
jgi:predicted transcriptional regulator